MRRSPEQPPATSLLHLTEADLASSAELVDMRALQAAGWSWRGLVLGSALEHQFYRLNNLPRRLVALFRGLDPADPDEDIVEEAEEDAVRLIAQHYLLDETVDAFYDALARLPSEVVLRRAGSAHGRKAAYPRAALLELKQLFQDDWRTDALLDRMALTASLAIDARPVIITSAAESLDPVASERAGQALGRQVSVWLDESGAFTRVLTR